MRLRHIILSLLMALSIAPAEAQTVHHGVGSTDHF